MVAQESVAVATVEAASGQADEDALKDLPIHEQDALVCAEQELELIKITVWALSGKEVCSVQLDAKDSVAAVREAVMKASPGMICKLLSGARLLQDRETLEDLALSADVQHDFNVAFEIDPRLRTLLDNFHAEDVDAERYLSESTQLLDIRALFLCPRDLYVRGLRLGSYPESCAGIGRLCALKRLEIDLVQRHVNDIGALEGLRNLHHLEQLKLDLRNNRITDIKPLEAIGDLRELEHLSLHLQLNKIGDITPLEVIGNLTGLRHLSLALFENPLEDIRALEGLRNLEKVEHFLLDLEDTIASRPLNLFWSLRDFLATI